MVFEEPVDFADASPDVLGAGFFVMRHLFEFFAGVGQLLFEQLDAPPFQLDLFPGQPVAGFLRGNALRLEFEPLLAMNGRQHVPGLDLGRAEFG